MKSETIAGIIIVLIILVAAGFYFSNQKPSSQTGTAPVDKSPIKIGVILPLTGDGASYGLPAQNMLNLALGEINSAGGADGRKLELIYEDGKCSGKDSAASMQKLADLDKVKVVVGLLCSTEALAAEPIATQNKIFLLSIGASSPALTGKSLFFARDYPSDATQGRVLAEISNKKGWKKVAFIQEQLDYPIGIYKAFSTNFEKLGGSTVKEEFATSTTDFRSTLLKLKSQNPDALFVDTQTPATSERIFKQLEELEWRPKLLITDATAGDLETVKRNANLLEATLAAEFGIADTNSKYKHMFEAYKNKYGKDPEFLSYAQTEYDGLFLIADAIKAVGYDGEKIANFMRNVKDWQGASGSVTIGQDGDRTGGHIPKIIRNGKTEIYTE